MAVVSVVSVGVFVPAGQSVHVDALGREPDSHVSVPALGDDLYLEVVDSTGGRNRMCSTDGRGVLVGLAVTVVADAEIVLGEPDVVVLVLGGPASRQRGQRLIDHGIEETDTLVDGEVRVLAGTTQIAHHVEGGSRGGGHHGGYSTISTTL